MLYVKCISKNRNSKGVIVSYTLQDSTGDTMTVTSNQLKDAIMANKVEVDTLKITADGRIINKTERDKDYNKLVSEQDMGQYSKALILGVAPILNKYGHVSGMSGNKVVFTDNTNYIANNIENKEGYAIFKGNQPLRKDFEFIGIKLSFKDVTIYNYNIEQNIGASPISIVIVAPYITLKHNYISINTIDNIFNILRKQKDNNVVGEIFQITFDNEIANLNKDKVYQRTIDIIKRQSKSKQDGRRAYDLMIQCELIYNMYISTGCVDKRYKKLIEPIYEELTNLIYRLTVEFNMSSRNVYEPIARSLFNQYSTILCYTFDLEPLVLF